MFYNLSWKWLTLIYSIYKIRYISNYHPEKMLNVDLVCLIVIEKTKTKIKVMWDDLSSYATLTRP